MKRPRKPFSSLPRSRRKKETFHVKQQIHRERERCGGLFYDHCDIELMTESGLWTWSDILFLSADRATFWNATISTANDALACAVENQAIERATAITTVAADIADDGVLDLSPLRDTQTAARRPRLVINQTKRGHSIELN
ncbi:hypothetical protein [Kluyvera sichuanensis]|uniref:Uncharacterized protein n=1 Tax=Kluyvera sichuanensis TaxID=2725494 RepID=A0ABR6RQX3_9ENTR|nr:hypothetical protein [Kluyvera sichuanensis]MBC1185530.1 hypothetical protein [Kluyvera sichuanensis]